MLSCFIHAIPTFYHCGLFAGSLRNCIPDIVLPYFDLPCYPISINELRRELLPDRSQVKEETRVKERLFAAVKKSKADYTEVRFETRESSNFFIRKHDLEVADYSTFKGGIVRACIKGGWGHASFEDLADLDSAVSDAEQRARLVGNEKTVLAEVPHVDDDVHAVPVNDFRGVGIDEKIALIRSYNDIILETGPAITSTRAGYSDLMRTVFFANSEGSWFSEQRPTLMCGFSATASKDGLVQEDGHVVSSADDYNAVLGLEEEATVVSKRACALLEADQCPGGVHTVIIDPEMGGLFTHEAFGHLSEADSLFENPRILETMYTGRNMGPAELNIIDEGNYRLTRASCRYDDEGTPTGKTYLIKNGVLCGHLHSRETAAKMGERPTGNARAVRRFHPPIVRMTNTYIDNGTLSKEELFQGVDNGIYVRRGRGGQTMMEMFTFSAGFGHRIENGEIGELVRDVALTGNVFSTLAGIDGIADDLQIYQGGGGCGKWFQSPLPVAFGSPHIRIRDVVVGGKGGNA